MKGLFTRPSELSKKAPGVGLYYPREESDLGDLSTDTEPPSAPESRNGYSKFKNGLQGPQTCKTMFLISGVLFVGCFATWFYWVTNKQTSHAEIMTCQLNYYTFYWFRHASVWTLTIMTGEKMLSIIFPFKAKTFSTLKMAKIVSAIMVTFWGLFDFKWIFAVKTVKQSNQNPDGCERHMSKKLYNYFGTLNEVFYSLLPCILIFVFNITIIFKLLFAKFKSQQSNQTSAVSKTAMNTTLMLLSVSVSFLILTSPIAISYLIFLD